MSMKRRKLRKEIPNDFSDVVVSEEALHRPFTRETRYIICIWDIKGTLPKETARLLTRPVSVIEEVIKNAKESGYYEKVRRYLNNYEIMSIFNMEHIKNGWLDG